MHHSSCNSTAEAQQCCLNYSNDWLFKQFGREKESGGWLSGWRDGWMDGWMGHKDGCTCGWMDGFLLNSSNKTTTTTGKNKQTKKNTSINNMNWNSDLLCCKASLWNSWHTLQGIKKPSHHYSSVSFCRTRFRALDNFLLAMISFNEHFDTYMLDCAYWLKLL